MGHRAPAPPPAAAAGAAGPPPTNRAPCQPVSPRRCARGWARSAARRRSRPAVNRASQSFRHCLRPAGQLHSSRPIRRSGTRPARKQLPARLQRAPATTILRASVHGHARRPLRGRRAHVAGARCCQAAPPRCSKRCVRRLTCSQRARTMLFCCKLQSTAAAVPETRLQVVLPTNQPKAGVLQ
jgi:hypothetical protein